jgi:two-component system chemotaxis response regulator CheB
VKRIVVIGASAGGIRALRTVLGQLPAGFPAPIAVVVHTSPHSPGVLNEILDRAGELPAAHARDGEPLRDGHVYVAPPDYHMLVEPGLVRLTRGPRENRFRPAVDPLFRSAAQVYGPGAIGVVLTGNLDDGTAGLTAIKQLGGTAIVQDPADAAYPSMPRSALLHVDVDHVVPLAAMPALLATLAGSAAQLVGTTAVPDPLNVELQIAREEPPLRAGLERVAIPSAFACPECHGVLLRIKESRLTRFRCHTGHAYTAEALLAALNESIEASLWGAVRAIEEGAMLASHMATHARERDDLASARHLTDETARLNEQMNVVRSLLTIRSAATATKR